MRTFILILCLLATPVMAADTYILTIVPEAELDAYVTNANGWQMEKSHVEVVNKSKMPKYTKAGTNYYISCMPATYFKGKVVADAWVTTEAAKSKVVIAKTENPSDYLSKNGYEAPKVDLMEAVGK